MPVIYRIASPKGKIYIGQTWNLKQRVYKYQTCHTKSQPHLHNSLVKDGWQAHTIDIICILPQDIDQSTLDRYEQTYIDFYADAGFTLMNVRGAGSRGKLSTESKNKVSQGLKKYYQIPENRKKVSEKLKEYFSSEENRNRHSKFFTNRKHTIEQRIKIADANKAYGPRPWLDKYRIGYRRKKCFVDGVVFDSAKDASIKLNIPYVTMIHRLKNTRTKWKNYHYE